MPIFNYDFNMNWYTPRLQQLFYLASITTHEETKHNIYAKIANLRTM